MKDYLDKLCRDKKEKIEDLKKLRKYENSFYSTFLNSLAGYSGRSELVAKNRCSITFKLEPQSVKEILVNLGVMCIQ